MIRPIPSTRLRPLLAPAAAAVALLVVAATAARVVARDLPAFDDAFMFARYAHNVRAGHGFAWNPGGPPTYGFTSLLYLLLITALSAALPLTDNSVLLLASAACGLAAAGLLVFICARAARSPLLQRRYAVWAGTLLPLLLIPTNALNHFFTGMDTTLALLTNTLLAGAVLRYLAQPGRRTGVWLPAAAFLTYQARPDNGLYALLLPLLATALLGPRPRRRRHALLVTGALLALLAVDAWLKARWLGSPVPLAFFAKANGYLEGYLSDNGWNPFGYLLDFGLVTWPFWLALGAFGRQRHARDIVVWLLPVALTVAYLFSVKQIMGFWGRFYLPALPLVVVAAVRVLDDALARHGARALPALRLWVVPGLLVLAGGLKLAAAAYQALVPVTDLPVASLIAAPDVAPLPRLGDAAAAAAVAELAQALPSGSAIALTEVGRVGAAAPAVVLVDMAGLNDTALARGGFSAESILARRPDLIWGPPSDYSGMRYALLSDPAFWADYDYYPEAFDHGLAVRHDAASVVALVRARWVQQYPGTMPEAYRAGPR